MTNSQNGRILDVEDVAAQNQGVSSILFDEFLSFCTFLQNNVLTVSEDSLRLYVCYLYLAKRKRRTQIKIILRKIRAYFDASGLFHFRNEFWPEVFQLGDLVRHNTKPIVASKRKMNSR